jgi:alkylation response protein AidB-like acyl-CoA dehydrogenase
MNELLEGFRRATLPPHALALRERVHAFLEAQAPVLGGSVKRARSWMGFDAAFSRALAAEGFVGLTLPREYGGAGLDAFARFTLVEELLIAGAPVAAHWIADRQSGPLILRYGSEAQKRSHLPRICAGEAFFCIGMSEPDAGSDLASVRTRATRLSGGGWKLDGRKIWTTNAHRCHYMIALVRTGAALEQRHAGLSQFIVDLKLPGVEVRPIMDLNGEAHFNEVLFDGVMLADEALVGAEGAGWEQVNSELAFERSGPERLYSSLVLLERWVQRLRELPAAQRRGADVEAAGRFVAHLATLRAMSLAVTARLAAGASPLLPAALVKDLGTTFEQEIPAFIEAALAADPAAEIDADLWLATQYISHVAPTFSLRGGTREILRGMIARGLGLR